MSMLNWIRNFNSILRFNVKINSKSKVINRLMVNCDHFGFKADDNDEVIGGGNVHCFHCQKVFVLCGLNTSIIHYQQHKHPAKYNLLLSNSVGGQENMKQTSLSHFVMGRNMPV